MRKNRCEVIDESEVGVYHVMSACGRQRFLFGRDHLTGRDYSYRRDWVVDLLGHLATCFAVDASAFAVLMNHFHLILRNRPDLAESWSEEEVAIRWWRRTFAAPEDQDKLPSEAKLRSMVEDSERIETLRRRLASPSWFMKELKQPIARRANKEDGVRGHFFEGRFKAFKLHEELDVVAANLYVDLNEIRAGIATSIEEAQYSSAYRRLARLKKAETLLLAGDPEQAEYYAPSDPDFWLAPINETGEAPPLFSLPEAFSLADEESTEGEQEEGGETDGVSNDESSARTDKASRAAKKKFRRKLKRRGLLPMSLREYLRLLDQVGREAAPGKRGVIDPELPPILERMNRQSDTTLGDRVEQLFRRFGQSHTGRPEQREDSHPTSERASEEHAEDEASPEQRSGGGGGRDPTP